MIEKAHKSATLYTTILSTHLLIGKTPFQDGLKDINYALEWFKNNQMAANPDKCQVNFMELEKSQKLSLETNSISIKVAEVVRLLGIRVDSELQFQSHVDAFC